jgi:uncharacterized membrane protein YdjX (TVP38/TMEM64 family)
MSMNRLRLLLLLLIVAGGVAAWLLDAGRYLSLDALRSSLLQLQAFVRGNPIGASLGFVAAYTVLASLNVPGAALTFTLGAGALFGTLWGSVLASIGSSIGATVGCALSRFLLQEFVERQFPAAVQRVNEGLRTDGAYYLFGLRLVPVFPFFVINLVMGLTRMPLRTFYWVSQAGMLPGTVVFVNAGTQLARIESPGDILTPGIALSLAALGVFPLVARRATNALLAWHRARA